MTEITKEIKSALRTIMTDKNVKIPLAIESGSRGWSFNSTDADYDCRFVYVHDINWYLSVFSEGKKDTIQNITQSDNDTLDLCGWDLRKFLQHLVKSNVSAADWLQSDICYLYDEKVVILLKEVAERYFNPVSASWQYLSLAKKKYAQIAINPKTASIKAYSYVLRPLINNIFIEQFNQIPFASFQKNLDAISLENSGNPEELRQAVNRYIEIRRGNTEWATMESDETLLNFIREEIPRQEERIKGAKFEKIHEHSCADEVFREIIEIVWDGENKSHEHK